MHNFCLLNIKRPVLSFVFSLLLVVFGLYTFFELSTRELPKNLQPPEVVISTKYTGASPSIIASEISEPIELAVGGAEGIKSIDTLSVKKTPAKTYVEKYIYAHEHLSIEFVHFKVINGGHQWFGSKREIYYSG